MAIIHKYIYNSIFIAMAALFCMLASSCSNTKNLPAGESLFVGREVTIKDDLAEKKEKKVIKSDLEDAIRPKPNTKLLGMRVKLRIYNFAGEPKKPKGLRNWLRTKVGEPPVLSSSFDQEKNRLILVNILENRGFFQSKVSGYLDTGKNRKSVAKYEVYTGPQYLINQLQFGPDTTEIGYAIAPLIENSLLVPGAPFNLDLIKGERERLDKLLKEKGFYYFNPDYLLIKADTTIGNHKVNLYLGVKHGLVPPEALTAYNINNVFIYPNYRLSAAKQDTNKANSIYYKGYFVVDRRKRKTFKPFVFSQAMQFQPGDIYSRTDHNTSLNRLVNLGTFKFVKNRFEPVEGTSLPMLDVYYYLTPYPKKSLQTEIGALTQNDSRAGSQLSISWRNRNTFRGAELLTVKLRGGFEAQYGGVVRRPNTYQVGAEVNLSIPRFVVPFVNIKSSGTYIPRTIIKTGYDYSLRAKLYDIHSAKVSYGYAWKEDARKDHQLFPFNVTYVRTDTLETDNVDLDLNFSNLVFNGVIIGPTYEYTFNSQVGAPRTHNYYFNGLIDFSANILGLAQNASQDNIQTIFGAQYAQYMKYQTDFRYYYKVSESSTFANRLFLGFGYPYGNSTQLPNIKQFFSGGNSSLRGFRSRLVGPGTFNEKYLTGQYNFIETLGDVKLEFNTELRTKVINFVNTAVFFDAGNIWTYYDDTRFPGGQFSSSFFKELAADAGVGLRLDFKIILLRLDLGIPVRKPWLPEGERWVFDDINFGDPTWRRENMIFNIAIGFPF